MLKLPDDIPCQNCGTALPMCLYWKIHGYVACCPECKHGSEGRMTGKPIDGYPRQQA